MKTAKQIAEAANGGMPIEVVIDHFRVKQKQDYAFKKNYARVRAWEFYEHEEIAGNAYVAVGGLDSITLFVFLRSIGIDVPGISVSRPHRFDRLRERNPKEWNFWMYDMGLGKILDYIDVPWEGRADGQIEGQKSMFEMLEGT